MSLEKNPYIIIEDFLDPEYCKSLAKYFIKNMEEDPRDFYATYGLGGKNDFFLEKTLIPRAYDPDNKIHETIHFAYNLFKNTYPMVGEFELNRSHANMMFTESFLHSHKDDRNWDEPIKDLASMTYVCGLFLTDDYEGGELTFEDYDISLKPKPGTLVLFPGYYTRHGVNKVTSGTRINILNHFFDIIDRDNINSSYM